MSNLDFIKKLYNGKNCYSDHMSNEEIELLHVSSNLEGLIKEMLGKGKIIFLTGNPGDGKTFLIKAVESAIQQYDAYVERDVNNITSYTDIVNDIVECYRSRRPAIIAINEYPFTRFCKQMKTAASDIYKEIVLAKKESISYDVSKTLTGRTVVVDLNNRNLLDENRGLLGELVDKILYLIQKEPNNDACLQYNLKALSVPEIKKQLLSLFQLAAREREHIAVRDILGALSFIFTACLEEDHRGQKYYAAIFNGTNPLLWAVQQFDPIYLSSPTLDEKLWNGELKDGWIIERPRQWPGDPEFEDNVEAAVECFKNIKRKYYFENIHGHELFKLQPDEIKKYADIFNNFDARKRRTKGQLIKSINRLFLPSSDEKRQLRIWTTHRYDMSIPASVAVSSKFIDAGALDIHMPRPADWLKGMEFVPNYILMTPKGREEPKLWLDMDFIRTMYEVENGYPVSLLNPKYEQAAAMFLQQLDDEGLTECNDDGEILIASRSKNQKLSVYLQDGKYGFEEE